MTEEKIKVAFCDRNNPCWFKLNGKEHIAPNGGNFIIKTDVLKKDEVRKELKKMYDSCDNSYQWAVYVEYKWGMLFFIEGSNCYDIKGKRIFTRFQKSNFYLAPDNIKALYEHYELGKKLNLKYNFPNMIKKIFLRLKKIFFVV